MNGSILSRAVIEFYLHSNTMHMTTPLIVWAVAAVVVGQHKLIKLKTPTTDGLQVPPHS